MEMVEKFVLAHTTLAPVPYVPEIRLHLAVPGAGGDDRDDEVYAIWERAGRLPYWAYAWAGGQALARHVLDHPETVRGLTVLDLATGSGLVAVAAALAGAAAVIANDVDPHALAAVTLNARANGVTIGVLEGDILDRAPAEDVVLAGDVFYERTLADRVTPFLGRARGTVLAGAPDRACSYLPRPRFQQVAAHAVPALLEDSPIKLTPIWRYIHIDR